MRADAQTLREINFNSIKVQLEQPSTSALDMSVT